MYHYLLFIDMVLIGVTSIARPYFKDNLVYEISYTTSTKYILSVVTRCGFLLLIEINKKHILSSPKKIYIILK